MFGVIRTHFNNQTLNINLFIHDLIFTDTVSWQGEVYAIKKKNRENVRIGFKCIEKINFQTKLVQVYLAPTTNDILHSQQNQYLTRP